MPTYTFWNLDSVQQSRIPAGNVTRNFSTQQGNEQDAPLTTCLLLPAATTRLVVRYLERRTPRWRTACGEVARFRPVLRLMPRAYSPAEPPGAVHLLTV